MPGMLIDHVVLDRLYEGVGRDLGVIEQVIERYLSELEGRIDGLRSARREPMQLSRAAHALASPSVTLGVRVIAEPCLSLERSLEEGPVSVDYIDTCIGHIAAAVPDVRTDLATWLNTKLIKTP